MKSLHHTVRLDATGIAKVLGDLEARVMEVGWLLGGPATARGVHEAIVREHPVALLTVVTVLNKLVAKGLMSRRKVGGIYHYAPTASREEFLARACREILDGVLPLGTAVLAASFVDVLQEQDPEQLGELARLVRRRLRDRR